MKKEETRKQISVAIDGPSGAGKSSLAKALAKQYHLIYVDTGAIYRTVGLAAQYAGISSKDGPAIIAMLPLPLFAGCELCFRLLRPGRPADFAPLRS